MDSAKQKPRRGFPPGTEAEPKTHRVFGFRSLRGAQTPKTLEFHGKPPKRFTLVKLHKPKPAKRFLFAQGIEAVSFFAAGTKDTSG
jgi:hypothetical protein